MQVASVASQLRRWRRSSPPQHHMLNNYMWEWRGWLQIQTAHLSTISLLHRETKNNFQDRTYFKEERIRCARTLFSSLSRVRVNFKQMRVMQGHIIARNRASICQPGERERWVFGITSEDLQARDTLPVQTTHTRTLQARKTHNFWAPCYFLLKSSSNVPHDDTHDTRKVKPDQDILFIQEKHRSYLYYI